MDHIEKLNAKALEMRSLALSKVGMTPEDLAKLNMLPLVTGIVGVFVIIIMWGAVVTPAWIKGTMMDLQPYEAHLSLTHARFGGKGEYNTVVCGQEVCPGLSLGALRRTLPHGARSSGAAAFASPQGEGVKPQHAARTLLSPPFQLSTSPPAPAAQGDCPLPWMCESFGNDDVRLTPSEPELLSTLRRRLTRPRTSGLASHYARR